MTDGVDAVAPNIIKRPPTFCSIHPDIIFFVCQWKRKAGSHKLDVAYVATTDNLLHPFMLGMKIVHESFHKVNTVFRARTFNFFHIIRCQRSRSFTENMLTFVCCSYCPLFMYVTGGWYSNRTYFQRLQ